MKSWVIDYAVDYMDGSIVDFKTDFKAATIREALDMAEKMIAELVEKEELIERAAIWNISIVDMNPF